MAQWPLIVAHLVTFLPTLPGWAVSDDMTVFDGAARDVQTTKFATIAHAPGQLGTSRGNYTVAQSPDGFGYIETGSVHNLIASADDSETLADVSSDVFALINALETAIREDRRLAVLSADGYFTLAVDITSLQIVSGSGQQLPFSLNYFTVTYQ